MGYNNAIVDPGVVRFGRTGEGKGLSRNLGRKNINVLLTTASGRRVRLIKAFRDALSTLGNNGKIITTDTNPLSPGFFVSDKSYLVPRISDKNHVPALMRICRKERVRIIIPTTDMDLTVLSAHEGAFRDLGAEVAVSEKRTIGICDDKVMTWSFFVKNQIPVPRYYSMDQLRNGAIVSFPVFIKPRRGAGTRDCYRVENRGELQFYLTHVKDPFVQEYVRGKEFTIDTFSDLEGNVIAVVPRERIEVRAGVSDKGRTVKDDRLMHFGKIIAEKLKIKGPACVQCIYDGKEFRFTEINPRFSGGISLTIASGVHFPLLLLKAISGEQLEPIIGNFKKDVLMLVYEEAIYMEKNRWKRSG